MKLASYYFDVVLSTETCSHCHGIHLCKVLHTKVVQSIIFGPNLRKHRRRMLFYQDTWKAKASPSLSVPLGCGSLFSSHRKNVIKSRESGDLPSANKAQQHNRNNHGDHRNQSQRLCTPTSISGKTTPSLSVQVGGSSQRKCDQSLKSGRLPSANEAQHHNGKKSEDHREQL